MSVKDLPNTHGSTPHTQKNRNVSTWTRWHIHLIFYFNKLFFGVSSFNGAQLIFMQDVTSIYSCSILPWEGPCIHTVSTKTDSIIRSDFREGAGIPHIFLLGGKMWRSEINTPPLTQEKKKRVSGWSGSSWQGLPLCKRTTPTFVWVSGNRKLDLPFHAASVASIRTSLWWKIRDILTVSVSTEEASWWRMSGESQKDKKQEWCPCVSSLCQINRADRQLCVCLHKGIHSEL